MIQTDQQLEHAVAEASRLLQEIQDYLGRNPNPKGRVQFPRNFIRPADSYRARIGLFIRDPVLKKNLSYNFMLSNVYLWLLIRTDLSSIAADMIVKSGLILAGSICESILKHVSADVIGNKKSYKERTKHLSKAGVIASDLHEDLDWLWDRRNNIHLGGIEESEFYSYECEHYTRAAHTVQRLISALADDVRNAPAV